MQTGPIRRKRKSAAHYRAVFDEWLVGRAHTADEGKDEWEAYCPAHEQVGISRPSARICFDDGHGKMMWYCFVCSPSGAEGHLDVLEDRLRARDDVEPTPTDIAVKRAAKAKSAGLRRPPIPVMSKFAAETYMENLWRSKDMRDYLLRERGITVESIIQNTIGWWPERKAFTIPLFTSDDDLANVRLTFPFHTEKQGKAAWQATGTDHPLLFGYLLQPGDDVLVVEGEWDAVLARQLGFNAVTAVRGASGWHPDDSAALEGCHVTVLMDNDEAGHKGEKKIVESIKTARLSKSIRVVRHEIAGADFTDMVVLHRWDRADILALIEAEPRQSLALEDELPTRGRKVSFDALSSRNSAKEDVESTVMVNARIGQYRLPWRGSVSCAMDQGSKCGACQLSFHAKAEGATMDFTLDRRDRDVYLPMVGVDDSKRNKHLTKTLGLLCGKTEWEHGEYLDVEHLIVNAPIIGASEDGRGSNNMLEVYLVGSNDAAPGEMLRIVGRGQAEAKRQGAVFMAWHKDDDNPLRERRILTQEEDAALRAFRTPDDMSVMEHATAIASSLNNQYGIVGRDTLMLSYLLVASSVRDFLFRGNMKHGWLQCFIVGDTRTGKSMAAESFLNHIGLGSMIKCDVATRAGLVGGMDSSHGATYLRMGLLPRCDGMMAFLDETTNIMENSEIMRQLTDMRSSGVMALNMVQSAKFSARVRQVWMSNPPDDRKLGDFPFGGIQAIGQMIKTPQDLARFDFLYAVADNDGIGREINTVQPKRAPSRYTPDLLRLLIEWIWTRKHEDVLIDPDTETLIGRLAQELAERYRSRKYLVFPASEAGVKVARIAIAFAALKYSTSNGKDIVVKAEHVAAAQEFLQTVFDSDDLGFGQFVKSEVFEGQQAEAAIPQVQTMLRSRNSEMSGFIAWIGSLDRPTFGPRDFDQALHAGALETLGQLKLIERRGADYEVSRELLGVARAERLRRVAGNGSGVA